MGKSDYAKNQCFPSEIVGKCRSHPNGVFRAGKQQGLLRGTSVEPSILEVEKPKLFHVYDSFEIQDFTYEPSTGKVHFMVQMSMKESWHELGIRVQLLDLDKEEVLGNMIERRGEDSARLVLEDSYVIPAGRADSVSHLGLIAYGNWGRQSLEENELDVFQEANENTQVRYTHTWPRKEDNTVILGEMENRYPDRGSKGDDKHIVIALIRRPEDMSDVDYLCGFGRDKTHNNHPVLCVPGSGEIEFSEGEVPAWDEEHKNTAVCKLYRKNGGVVVAASTEDYAYSIDNTDDRIKITPISNGYQYQFISWYTGYDDPAGWTKTEFQYHLEMRLFANGGTKEKPVWKKYDIIVSSMEEVKGATRKIYPLQIMYGCLASGTRILTKDRGEVPIQDICRGEKIVGENGEIRTVYNIWKGPEDRMMEFRVEGTQRNLKLTEDHPLLVRRVDGIKNWQPAGSCKAGESLLYAGESGDEWKKITEIRRYLNDGEVWNLELKDPEESDSEEGYAMIANGFYVGDFRMQNSSAIWEQMKDQGE